MSSTSYYGLAATRQASTNSVSLGKLQDHSAAHNIAMTEAIRKLGFSERNKLQRQHEIITQKFTMGLSREDKTNIDLFMDSQFTTLMEREQERVWKKSGKTLDSHLCLYLKDDWIYVVAYTKNLGYVNVAFDTSNRSKPGFPGKIGQINGTFAWSHDYQYLKGSYNSTLQHIESLHRYTNIISKGSFPCNTLASLFLRVKEFVEMRMEERISQIMLIIPTRYNYQFSVREIFRECFKAAGFERVAIVHETTIAANKIFSTLSSSKLCSDRPSALVITLDTSRIRIDVFGYGMSGLELLALSEVTFKVFQDSINNIYEKVLAQISSQKRKSIRYYVVYNALEKERRCQHTEDSVHQYFDVEQKLMEGNEILGYNLKDVFSVYSSDSYKLKPFDAVVSALIGSASIDSLHPQENIAGTSASTMGTMPSNSVPEIMPRKLVTVSPNVSSTENYHTKGLSAKLPLQLCTQTGKVCKIIAKTNWSVRRLKEELQKTCGQQHIEQLVLQYVITLDNDDRLLSSYKMEPDSVIQANFGNVDDPIVEGQNTSENPGRTIQLIGNCVALQNGIEIVEVQGIKRGSLIVCRPDLDNLTLGEVAIICTINGFGNLVYVGVKFRRQLALGNLEIQIEHKSPGQGFCDKCKGRKSLFIPRDQVGKSKHHLFQVQ